MFHLLDIQLIGVLVVAGGVDILDDVSDDFTFIYAKINKNICFNYCIIYIQLHAYSWISQVSGSVPVLSVRYQWLSIIL